MQALLQLDSTRQRIFQLGVEEHPQRDKHIPSKRVVDASRSGTTGSMKRAAWCNSIENINIPPSAARTGVVVSLLAGMKSGFSG